MINTIDGIIAAAKGEKTGVIAVAAAHDQPVIEAVVEARREGIATPILVGHEEEIKAMLTGLGEAPADYEIIAGDTDQDCAAKAVALCAEGKANFLMKGILGTADLMRAVFNLTRSTACVPIILPPTVCCMRSPPWAVCWC